MRQLIDAPWIFIEQYRDKESPAEAGFSDYIWQALFACQIDVRSHQEWVKLKWGFNASALFDETLERQRLFLESQYVNQNDLGAENPDHLTLAFRYINRPGEGLLVTALGKIHAQTEADAMEGAMAFYREIKSIFPYDYTLVPALSRDEFLQLSGWDVLDNRDERLDLAQIRRLEVPIYRKIPAIQGLWQSSPRAHEQIWRTLAASPYPVLLNTSIRCTLLYEKERQSLLKSMQEISDLPDDLLNSKTLSALKLWNSSYTERRLSLWKKFFYLQVHLASTRKIDEHLFRITGTSLALGKENNSLPGYQVISPKSNEVDAWRKKLMNLDFVFSKSYLPIPRFSEVADMDEVFSVVRLPYLPPENGFPDMNFVSAKSQ